MEKNEIKFSKATDIKEAMSNDGYDMDTVKAFYLYDPFVPVADMGDENIMRLQPKCMDVKGLAEFGIFSIREALDMFPTYLLMHKGENVEFDFTLTGRMVQEVFVREFEEEYPFKSLVSACIHHKDTDEYQPICICYGK